MLITKTVVMILLLPIILHLCFSTVSLVTASGIPSTFVSASQQDFTMNNAQAGSFELIFDQRGYKHFAFQDWKSVSSIAITPLAVMSGHLFQTAEDALITHDQHGRGIIIMLKHANYKLDCHQNSTVRISTYNDHFYVIQQTNCYPSSLTRQDSSIFTQAALFVS